ncbi:tetratricopeptide repeat protein [Methanosarcina sp.]|uniref:tetratricopeptide repeat protein n=1 Tax=Methanosarcina sp. TaxID=2213 RepID=UPI002ABC4591|nr:tetratricopeptide repeat protein [Methanosarcina sp.]MDY9927154.1 tetratricopeptide repeat protein [Methanosarcina sp.]
MSRSKVKNLLLLKQIHSAVTQIKKGKLDKALDTLDKAEKSARQAKSTDALYYILFTRGGILYSAKEYDQALETYERALEVGSDLLKTDPENDDYQHYMGTTLSNTGNLLKKKGEMDRAAGSYSRAREIYSDLITKNPENVVFHSYAGENLNNYGALLIESGSQKTACEILKEAVETYEKLLENKPDNPGYQAELSVALSQFGSCLKQQEPEKAEIAKKNLERALKMQENLLAQQPENKKIEEAITLTRERLERL